MTSTRKAAVGFIFITLLIDVTGLGLIIPVMPDLIKELTGQSTSEAAGPGGLVDFSLCHHAIFMCTCYWCVE